ncbi:TPA: tetratricopeptide repeat protein [Candidatus Poribacteria bacterium]|nr:tetratricopeptide repeat protein [Candidatus Poribacteria bacterium]
MNQFARLRESTPPKIALAVLLSCLCSFQAFADYSVRDIRQFEAEFRRTDREFIRLLKQAINHRLYLMGEQDTSPFARASYARNLLDEDTGARANLFPNRLGKADNQFLDLFYAPKHTDRKALIFDESRSILNEYRHLADIATPLETADIHEYVRVLPKPNSVKKIYSAIIDRFQDLVSIRDLKVYLSIVESIEDTVSDPGDLNPLSMVREDFRVSEYGPMENQEELFGFKRVIMSDNLAALELTRSSFLLALDNNRNSKYVPHARYRIGDILVEQTRVLLYNLKDAEAAEAKLTEAIEWYRGTALGIHPQFSHAEYVLFWLAQLDYDKGNVVNAQRSYERLVGSFPKNSGPLKLAENAIFMQSICNADLGHFVDARNQLSDLLTLGSGLFRRVAQTQLSRFGLPVFLFSIPDIDASIFDSEEDVTDVLIKKFGESGVLLSKDFVEVKVFHTNHTLIVIDSATNHIYNVSKSRDSDVVGNTEQEKIKLDVQLVSPFGSAGLVSSQYANGFNKLSANPSRQTLESIVVSADVLYETGDFTGAILTYEKAIDLYKRLSQDLSRNKSFTYLRQLDEWYYQALLNLSRCYYKLRNLDMCIANLNQLLQEGTEQNVVSPAVLRDVYLLRGDSYYLEAAKDRETTGQNGVTYSENHIENHEQVIRSYEQVKNEFPPLSLNRNNRLVSMYIALDVQEKAIDLVKDQIEHLKSTKMMREKVRQAELDLSYRMLGAIYWSIEDHDKAVSAYNQVQSGDGYNADVKDLVVQIQDLQSKLEQIQNLNN